MGYRPMPRISFLGLAKYLTSTPRGRERIVEQQANPPEAIVTQYRRGRRVARHFLRTGGTDHAYLAREIELLGDIVPDGDWDERDLANTIGALERITGLSEHLDLGDRVLRTKHRAHPLRIEGVDVTFRPAAFVVRQAETGWEVGAVSISWGKKALGKRRRNYAATLLRMYLEARVEDASDYEVAAELCQIAEPWSGSVHSAPERWTQRRRDIEAACREIARGWPAPPRDRIRQAIGVPAPH